MHQRTKSSQEAKNNAYLRVYCMYLVFFHLGLIRVCSADLLSPPYAQSFLRKPRFLVLASFFLGFLKPSNSLVFLGVVYISNEDQYINFTAMHAMHVKEEEREA